MIPLNLLLAAATVQSSNLAQLSIIKNLKMDEFDCINRYIHPLLNSGICTENDDAAIVSSPNSSFVVSHDMVTEGVHFLSNTEPSLLAKKALRVNLSDLAAMGATPNAYLLGLSLPAGITEEWWEKFSLGLKEDNENFNIKLVGGDTICNATKAITVGITIFGIPGKNLLSRSGAQDGDSIYVTGTIGDGALGLLAYESNLVGQYNYLKCRYDLPQPRVQIGCILSDIATACIDISDGFLQDVSKLCSLSQLGADIFIDDIPLSHEAKEMMERNTGLSIENILTGGDDYELAFTAPQIRRADVISAAEKAGVRVTEVGRTSEKKGIRLFNSANELVNITCHGYRHRF